VRLGFVYSVSSASGYPLLVPLVFPLARWETIAVEIGWKAIRSYGETWPTARSHWYWEDGVAMDNGNLISHAARALCQWHVLLPYRVSDSDVKVYTGAFPPHH
jgi:hypothetical protein